MKLPSTLPLLAFGAFALCGVAQATESVVHNDMDGDGRSDLLWRNVGTGSVVYWSAADPARSTKILVTAPSGFPLARMAIVGTGAFGDDGRSDLLMQDPVDAMVYNVYPKGAGYTAFATGWCCSLGSPWRLAGVADFDGDTYSDLVYRDQGNGANWWFSSVQWYGLSSLATVPNLAWKVAAVGDFDGDGISDLLWRNASTGQNSIWRSGNSKTYLRVATVSDLAWKIACVADFDGDGRSDIFWRNSVTGVNSLWPSANVGARRPLAAVTDQHWQVATTGDFNGDHEADVLWRNNATGANVIWSSADRSTRAVVATVRLTWSLQK